MEDLVLDGRMGIMAVFCEHGVEASGSIKGVGFLI
jgi:hypothetical protein